MDDHFDCQVAFSVMTWMKKKLLHAVWQIVRGHHKTDSNFDNAALQLFMLYELIAYDM